MGDGVLVIGVGNPMCGDDAAGVDVATRLARRLGNAVTVELDNRARIGSDPEPQASACAVPPESPRCTIALAHLGSRALWDVVDGTRRPEMLVIVDAALATNDLPIGSWCKIEYPSEAGQLDEQAFRNTHSLNLRSTLDLARTVGTLPAEVWIYGIAGVEFTLGAAASPEVVAAVERLEQELYRKLRSWLEHNPCTSSPSQSRSAALL